MKLRLARPEETDVVASIIRGLSRWLKSKGVPQWSDPVPLDVLEAEVSRHELFVLEENGEIIATVALGSEPDELWDQSDGNAFYLHRLAVVRSRAGENLGKAIVGWAESHAQSAGAGYLRLVCDANNLFLTGYYAELGYEIRGSKVHEPWKMIFVRYEKRL